MTPTPEQRQRTADAVAAIRRLGAGVVTQAVVDLWCWRIERITQPDLPPPPYDAAAQQRYARRP